MAPTRTISNHNHVRIHSDDSEDDVYVTPYATTTFRAPSAAARRITPPLISSSSSSTTPYSSPLHFKGIPFSWEKIPGIPKCQDQAHYKSKSTRGLLPLPPAGNAVSAATTKADPFLAALVECSKDDRGHDEDHVWKGSSKNFIARTLSDRFGFIGMYASCKRGCAVSESVVYLPRSSATPHYLFARRPNA